MKLTGCVLLLWAAGTGWNSARRQKQEALALAQALWEDLAVLKSRVCTGNLPLLQVLEQHMGQSIGTAALWHPLQLMLKRRTSPSLSLLWQEQAGTLPRPLGRILSPLGPMLREGGSALGRAIDETREELTRFIRTEHQKQAAEQKLSAALWFSGAALMILVLI